MEKTNDKLAEWLDRNAPEIVDLVTVVRQSEVDGTLKEIAARLRQQSEDSARLDWKHDPYRSGGFLNKDYDRTRVYVDLPYKEGMRLLKRLREGKA